MISVFFYNFGWPDYNVGSLATILDMVKVMQFALSEGKVAVHCHAGLGTHQPTIDLCRAGYIDNTGLDVRRAGMWPSSRSAE